jgi:hypothetical protein
VTSVRGQSPSVDERETQISNLGGYCTYKKMENMRIFLAVMLATMTVEAKNVVTTACSLLVPCDRVDVSLP